MDFTTLKTRITGLIDRSDYDTNAGIFINSAIHELEMSYNWRKMEASPLTGNLTTSVDYVAIPTRYKRAKSFLITVDTKEKPLAKKGYFWLKSHYPYGANSKGEPEAYAIKQGESRFYVRPYPQQTYAYELICDVFSEDLSDASPSNFWMTDMWEIVYYGALLQYELHSGKKLVLGTEDHPMSPTTLYNSLLPKLLKTHADEEYCDHPIYESVDYVY